jgi:hypothetical protein
MNNQDSGENPGQARSEKDFPQYTQMINGINRLLDTEGARHTAPSIVRGQKSPTENAQISMAKAV